MQSISPQIEENPFEDSQVAEEWIRSVEGERGLLRDRVIYPLLKEWAAGLSSSSTIVEIGAGQGICAEKLESDAKYVGIEPSVPLVARAKEKYAAPNREFIVGNAYKLPIADACADGAFAINVWFHLENLKRASEELARILKGGSSFLIVTANPAGYDVWENFYHSPEREGKKLVGKVDVPINPMTKNIFYEHSIEEITAALAEAGLAVTSADTIGGPFKDTAKQLFIAIMGEKP